MAFNPGELLRTILRDPRWPGGAVTASPAIRGGLAVLTLVVLGFAGFAVRGGLEPDGAGDAALAAADAAGAGTEGAPAGVAEPAGRGGPGVVGDGAHSDGGSSEPAPIVWAAPTEPSPVVPLPREERVPKPEAVRGIYVGSWPAGNAGRLDRLIRLAEQTEVNAFVIDVKDVTGEVSYATRVPLALQLGANRQNRIADVRGVLSKLRERGIYPIARIVVFKDPLLATARPEWSIVNEDGSVWQDDKGVHWVDSFNREVWDYNIELAREAIALGFSEIQWDYVRFPDVPSRYLEGARYPAREGRVMADAIREFMIHSQARLADLDVPVTADVFGVTTSAYGDVGIGQVWEKLADVTDVLLPMVYPSHYPRGTWGYERPNAAPYQIVKKALDHGVNRSRDIEGAALIRPWLQAFDLGPPSYGPEHIRAQIDAVYDAGLTEWILWDPAVTYPREAFASADGVEPWFAGRGAALYEAPLEVPEPLAPIGEPVDSGPEPLEPVDSGTRPEPVGPVDGSSAGHGSGPVERPVPRPVGASAGGG